MNALVPWKRPAVLNTKTLTAESARMAKTVAHSEAALQTAAAEEETHQRDLTAAASARTKAEETREKASARVLEAPKHTLAPMNAPQLCEKPLGKA